MTKPRDALDNLTDAMVDDILSMSDEEMLAEIAENEAEHVAVADRMRALFENVKAEIDEGKAMQTKYNENTAMIETKPLNECTGETRAAFLDRAVAFSFQIDDFYDKETFLKYIVNDRHTIFDPENGWPEFMAGENQPKEF